MDSLSSRADARRAERTVAPKRRTLTGLMALPVPVKRLLAGSPVVLEGQTLDVETQLVLRLQELTREPGAEAFAVPDGRRVLEAQSRVVGGPQPVGSSEDRTLGGLPGRVYVPRALLAGTRPRPTLVFLHGGGFVYGSLESHDSLCRVLAERAGVQVVAVDYRLAPEHPFPAAYDDSVAAYRWVVEHADELAVDTSRIAVGGDSAGANLAIGVALEAARQGLPLSLQLLLYPTTDSLGLAESRHTFSEGFFLSERFRTLAVDNYLPDYADRADPRASPLYADLPATLAPAHVVTAGFDPLRDEGEQFAHALATAGLEVDLQRYPALIHGFANWVGMGTSCPRAVREIADRFGRALR